MVMTIFLRMIVLAPIMAIGGLSKADCKEPPYDMDHCRFGAVPVCIDGILFSVGLPKMKRMQSLVDKLNLVTRENLTGMRVIRAQYKIL